MVKRRTAGDTLTLSKFTPFLYLWRATVLVPWKSLTTLMLFSDGVDQKGVQTRKKKLYIQYILDP
jgi:hypothetical protein